VSAYKSWPVEKIGKTWVEQELGAPETESPAMPKRRRRRRRSMILQPPAMIFAISNLQKESSNAPP
jgi:hypothetical protein